MENTNRNWHVLVVDDNPEIAEMNQDCLRDAGFAVTTVYTGEDCLEEVEQSSPDLILLDIDLPGISGFEVCTHIRAQDELEQPSIIMLTALNDIPHKITGLEGGADDYLTKPFEISELLARVRAQLRIRELQEKLREAGKLSVIGQAAIALSDKINSPLSSIIWQARLLQGDLRTVESAPESMIGALDNIVHDAHRIEQVVRRLHDINKLTFTHYDEHHIMLDLDESAPQDDS
jgi:two-component system sensor histidine kinase ChiS